MKNIIYIILIILIISVSACSNNDNFQINQDKNIIISIEDLNNENFNEGIYYEYRLSNEELKGIMKIDPELILNNLIKKNTPLVEAWYKSYASSCCPPNTKRCMQAIVQPVLLIKLNKKTDLENFVMVNEPNIGWCPYEVKHYKIK